MAETEEGLLRVRIPEAIMIQVSRFAERENLSLERATILLLDSALSLLTIREQSGVDEQPPDLQSDVP